METNSLDRTQIEKWADQFKEDFARYIETDSYKNQVDKDPVVSRFADILTKRIEVSEINFEIWVKDMVTGTQAFFEKDNITKEALGKIMAEFARKIASYEQERDVEEGQIIKPILDEN